MLLGLWTAGTASAATGSIEGTVTAASGGAALEGIGACAYEIGGDLEEACGLTDDEGEYLLDELEPGQYKVEFWDQSLEYIGQYYEDAEFWEDATAVAVTSGGTAIGIDAELDKAARIEGEVNVVGSGAPLEEVEVCAWGEESFRCGETGSDGKYVIAGLWPGEYEIEFWPWTEGNFAPQWWQGHDRWYEADPLTISAGQTETGVDAELSPAGQINGTVTSPSTGARLAEIPVCSIDPVVNQLYTCTETNLAGQYTLRRFTTAQYKVVFSPDFAEWFPGEESFDDGYPTQFWNGKPTLAAADPINLVAPLTVAGIDARLGTPPPAPQPPAAPAQVTTKKKSGKPCRKGFKKKKVKGKKRCVKIHKGKKGSKGKAGGKRGNRMVSRFGAVRIQP